MAFLIEPKKLFQILCCLLAFFTILVWFLQSDNPLFDALGINLVLGLFISVILTSGEFAKRYPLVLPINFIIFLFVTLRLTALVAVPNWLIGKATPEMLNGCLVFILSGLWSCYIGVANGTKLANRALPFQHNFSVRTSRFSIIFLGLLFLAFLLINTINYLHAGFAGSSMSGDKLDFFSRYIVRLFDPYLAIILLMVRFFFYPNPVSKFQRFFFWGLIIAYVAFITMTGGRSGVFEVAVFFVCIFCVSKKNLLLKVTPGRALALGCIIVSLPLLFNFATYLRGGWFPQKTEQDPNQTTFKGTIEQISHRLSLVEQTLHPMYAEAMGYRDISKMVTPKHTLLSALNRLIPGKPFGTLLFTEYAFGFLYYSEGNIISKVGKTINYSGFEWGMFGISYQLFGLLGGIAFIFLFTLLLSFAFTFFRNKNTFWCDCAAVLTAYSAHMWARCIGLDNFIDRFGHAAILLCLYIFLLELLRFAAFSDSLSSFDVAAEPACDYSP